MRIHLDLVAEVEGLGGEDRSVARKSCLLSIGDAQSVIAGDTLITEALANYH